MAVAPAKRRRKGEGVSLNVVLLVGTAALNLNVSDGCLADAFREEKLILYKDMLKYKDVYENGMGGFVLTYSFIKIIFYLYFKETL